MLTAQVGEPVRIEVTAYMLDEVGDECLATKQYHLVEEEVQVHEQWGDELVDD